MHEIFDDHLDLLRGQDKAKGTIKQYQGGLKAYSEWLEEQGIEPEGASTRDIQRYLSFLKNEREYAPGTVRGYYSCISGFYKNLDNTGVIEEDPTEGITLSNYASRETRKQQETKERRVWLSQEEMSQLVENVPAPTVRNRLLVLFQYFTGLRRQEVVDVKLEDIDRKERMVKVQGKGNVLNTAFWQPKMDGLLTAWLDGGYRGSSPHAEESPYLFLSQAAPQLSGEYVNRIVKEAAEEAGIQEVLFEDARGRSHYKYTSHALRHSFAMHWLQNGGSLATLSKQMAHSSITTTEIYGEILDERAKEEYDQYAPDIDLSF
ncbi:XerD/XerC family integrase [Halanaeroarchaeum sp. HSR-CO]|uniref:tyrosine-type recombinase/integrase n=1 Tax=Halanaeroarchaeum sp. HSR-CO TaxID=2866382 RepID=UPI00217CCAD3|nr:tyrosine-type recombinase/integrase [Halanaeroarchaeum sp. HSR-CO]UWG48184.1 XerD/XerC family integrase [Halanaeroarchaeum sp. HSR-CO]